MISQRNKRNQNMIKKKKNQIIRPNIDTSLLLIPEFPGQPNCTLKVTSDFVKLTTTVTTGAILAVATISSSGITNFTTRFAGFEEYRIVRSVLKINCFSSTNPGRIVAYVDPDDNTAPSLALSQAHRHITFAASDVANEKRLVYVPHDPAKQTWQTVATGTSATGYFKIYTSNGALGSSTVATEYMDYHMVHTIQFRGFVG